LCVSGAKERVSWSQPVSHSVLVVVELEDLVSFADVFVSHHDDGLLSDLGL
jgi:hypothetical protein